MGGEMTHLHVLADEIGPRPATTDAEAHAAEYIEAVFAARGLDVERQEFDTPRTYGWAHVIYNVLTIAAAVAVVYEPLVWPALAVAVLSAALFWLDLEARFGLTSLMPKGPSQNVVARHVPKIRRGERTRRVVIVAHYDSARASLAFSPAMAKNFRLSFGMLKGATTLMPLLVLANALPQTEPAQPWLWYATLVVAAYLLIPLVINVHRELFMRPVEGANDNASGVAAMLGVMEAVVPEPEAGFVPRPIVRRHGPQAAQDAELVSEDTLLAYAPIEAPEADEAALPDDFAWADSPAAPPTSRGQRMLEFDTIEFDAVAASHEDDSDADWPPIGSPTESESEPQRKKTKRFGGVSDAGVKGWLGLSDDFEARTEGRKIGSWDRFGGDDDDEEDFGFKGGWAGDDPIGDPEFAANEAARIRRRVTESVDRDLQEKEVWFVATGAEEVGSYGMRAFLKEYAEELRDAVIINIDGVGAGALYWVTSEGQGRHRRSDRRLVSLARRVSRENNLLVRPRAYRGLSTDATVALMRGFRAVSVMAFDVNGRIPNWHWYTDTSDNVSPELVELASAFVTAMVREA